MGYVRDSTYKLKFEEFADGDGNALEIRVKPLSVERWLALVGGDLGHEETLELFIDHLVGWNVEERDQDGEVSPVPATRKGVRSQDVVFVLQLVDMWAGKIGSVSAPLVTTSGDGQPSLEESLPMEPLSPSPVS